MAPVVCLTRPALPVLLAVSLCLLHGGERVVLPPLAWCTALQAKGGGVVWAASEPRRLARGTPAGTGPRRQASPGIAPWLCVCACPHEEGGAKTRRPFPSSKVSLTRCAALRVFHVRSVVGVPGPQSASNTSAGPDAFEGEKAPKASQQKSSCTRGPAPPSARPFLTRPCLAGMTALAKDMQPSGILGSMRAKQRAPPTCVPRSHHTHPQCASTELVVRGLGCTAPWNHCRLECCTRTSRAAAAWTP